MKTIPISSVSSWNRHGAMWIPAALDTACPKCGRFSTLVFSLSSQDGNTRTANGTLRCSRCGAVSSLIIVEPSSEANRQTPVELCIHPSPTTHRDSILGEIQVDERLDRAYKAALDAYNAGIWTASVTLCRRTLEGIVKLQLPEAERKGMLGQQLKHLPEHVDLSKPILQLADVLKDGGNIGAHFDMEREPDLAFATLMVDLTEYILEYLYVIPTHSEALKKRLESIE